MITHVAVVGVFVRDQEKALDFFVNKLGFEQRADESMGDGQRWLEVAPPGAVTRIVLSQATEEWGADKVGQWTGIVLAPDDIDATYQELSARGVEFTLPPQQEPWGKQALFTDQDGNAFVLVQRG